MFSADIKFSRRVEIVLSANQRILEREYYTIHWHQTTTTTQNNIEFHNLLWCTLYTEHVS